MTSLKISAIIFAASIVLSYASIALAYIGSTKKIKAAWSVGYIAMCGSMATCGIAGDALVILAIVKAVSFLAQILL